MLDNVGVYTIIISSVDLGTYQMVLQALSDFMVSMVGSGFHSTLIELTMLIAIGDIFINAGNIFKVKWINYATIGVMFVAFFTKTCDIALMAFDPIKYSNTNGQTYYVRNMPLAPAVILKGIYDLNYNVGIMIDRAFYSQTSPYGVARGRFFDKVGAYSEMLSGQIKDKALAGELASFIQNVLQVDVADDIGSSALSMSVFRTYDVQTILGFMYLKMHNQAISGLTDHSQELVYVIEDPKNPGVRKVYGQSQFDAHPSWNTIADADNDYVHRTAGEFYQQLLNNLNAYFDGELTDMSEAYPTFFPAAEFQTLKAAATKNYQQTGNAKIFQRLNTPRDFLLASKLSMDSDVLRSQDTADKYAMAESAIMQSKSARVNMMIVKTIYTTVINLATLVFMFFFPFIYILSFFPNFLNIVKNYWTGFITLAAAGPLGYFLEGVTNLMNNSIMAMNIAGGTAGLSKSVQDAMLFTMTPMPYAVTVIYGIFLGVIFSMGNKIMASVGAQFLGETQRTVDNNVDALAQGNQNLSNTSYGMNSALCTNVGNEAVGNLSRGGFSVDGQNAYAMGAQIAEFNKRGLDVPQNLSDFAQFAYKTDAAQKVGAIEGALNEVGGNNIVDTLGNISERSAYGSTQNQMNVADAAQVNSQLGMKNLEGFSKTLDKYAPNDMMFSQGSDTFFKLSAGFQAAGSGAVAAHVENGKEVFGVNVKACQAELCKISNGIAQDHKVGGKIYDDLSKVAPVEMLKEVQSRVVNSDGKNVNTEALNQYFNAVTAGGRMSGGPVMEEFDKIRGVAENVLGKGGIKIEPDKYKADYKYRYGVANENTTKAQDIIPVNESLRSTTGGDALVDWIKNTSKK